MQTTADYYCAYCGEPSTTFIDISGGLTQQYVEDCQVCCQPIQIRFEVAGDRLNGIHIDRAD